MLDLFYISLIVALIFESGFWESMDGYINERFKFRHLPHILMCQFCQTWWLCLFYIIITFQLSLQNIVICLLFANLGELLRPLIKITKQLLLSAIGWLATYIK